MNKKNILLIAGLIIACLFFYFYIVPKEISGPEATAKRFIKYLKHEQEDQGNVFDEKYSVTMLYKFDPPEVVNPDYDIAKSDTEKNVWWMTLKGLVTDAAGKLRYKEIRFKLTPDYKDNYVISDSYGFLAVNENEFVFSEESDLQKADVLLGMFLHIKIVDFNYEVKEDGSIQGHGRIQNNSPVMIRSFPCQVAYYAAGNDYTAIKKETFYAVDENGLAPGQTTGFRWSTNSFGDVAAAKVLPYLEWEKSINSRL